MDIVISDDLQQSVVKGWHSLLQWNQIFPLLVAGGPPLHGAAYFFPGLWNLVPLFLGNLVPDCAPPGLFLLTEDPSLQPEWKDRREKN